MTGESYQDVVDDGSERNPHRRIQLDEDVDASAADTIGGGRRGHVRGDQGSGGAGAGSAGGGGASGGEGGGEGRLGGEGGGGEGGGDGHDDDDEEDSESGAKPDGYDTWPLGLNEEAKLDLWETCAQQRPRSKAEWRVLADQLEAKHKFRIPPHDPETDRAKRRKVSFQVFLTRCMVSPANHDYFARTARR